MAAAGAEHGRMRGEEALHRRAIHAEEGLDQRRSHAEIAPEAGAVDHLRPGFEGAFAGDHRREKGPEQRAVLDRLSDALAGEGIDPRGLPDQRERARGEALRRLEPSLGKALLRAAIEIEAEAGEAGPEAGLEIDPALARQ